MEIKITYEEATSFHPDLVEVLIGKIQASKVRDKNKPAKDWEWYYSYGVTVRGMSFDEDSDKSSQNIVSEQLNSIIGLSLAVAIGRTRRYYVLPEKPKLFVQKFSENVLKELGDKNIINSSQNKIKEVAGVEINPNNIKPKEEEMDYDMDDILEKISEVGMDGLTASEKEFLKKQSA